MLEANLKRIRAGMALLLLELPMRVDEQIVRYYIMGEQMALGHMLATHGIMAQVVKLSKKFDAEFPMMETPQGEPEEVEFNLDDWINKECYFIYTAEEKEAIEAFENLLAVVATVPLAERIEYIREAWDDDQNAQEAPINLIRFDVMEFEDIRHERMIRRPEEELMCLNNISEEEDRGMEEPPMRKLPSDVREQPQSMMEQPLMWNTPSLWLRRQENLIMHAFQQPDRMMEETDRMADGNSTEGDDAMEVDE